MKHTLLLLSDIGTVILFLAFFAMWHDFETNFDRDINHPTSPCRQLLPGP
jgi:hypothetical protein